MLLATLLLATAPAPRPLDTVWRQVGPNPKAQQFSDLPIPGRHRPRSSDPLTPVQPDGARPDRAPAPARHDRLADCLNIGRDNPAMAVSLAEHWLAETKVPSEHVRADQCLGMMLTQQNDFTGAMGAFADAVSQIPASQAVGAVPLMAMAGNAALGAGKPQDALTWLDRALAVPGFADNPARAAMLNDRARALVALGRTADAATALGQAHTLAPDNAESWLLSATLARRDKNLTQAQHDIETAARLDPRNPAIGVEAGVIAELGQREDAARQSWQSVVAMAPDSDEAQVARGYLEQIGAVPTSASSAPKKAQAEAITR